MSEQGLILTLICDAFFFTFISAARDQTDRQSERERETVQPGDLHPCITSLMEAIDAGHVGYAGPVLL